MTKKFKIAVSDFALPAPRVGSIDIYAGFGNDIVDGLDIHQQVQHERKKEFKNYEAEVPISHEFPFDRYVFQISGRMDGVFHEETFKIEEIKSSFNIYELYRYIKKHQDQHPYCLQLKTYGYLHWLKTKELPDLCLHLVSTRKRESIDLHLKLNIDVYQHWLALRLTDLAKEAQLAEKTITRRKKTAKQFQFPFPMPRQGQVELIQTIENTLQDERPMLIQAPTGLGKTIGVLYPLLNEALHRGQKIIYVTPKNSQHTVAEDAIQKLQENDNKVKALTLTAKSKMCFKNEPICNSIYCEFAKDHYTKIAENNLTDLLAKKKNLTAKIVKDIAKTYQVCPFELQFEVIQQMDAVICDYNYVFSPKGGIGKVAANLLGQIDKPNLIIDEIHNLPSRGMDYYSPALSVLEFESILKKLDTISEPFRKKSENLIRECIHIIEQCGGSNGPKKPMIIHPPVEKFIRQDSKLREFLSNYLNSDVDIQPEDLIMKFTYYWSEFTKALEFIDLGKQEFFTTYYPHPATLKITCCDASQMLQPSYQDFKHVIGFSATLKPFEFYSTLTGLNSTTLKTAEFASPFSPSNRKIIIIPQVSTKYSERERSIPRIAEVIAKITTLRSGNYFVFFPSFDFLEKSLQSFIPPAGFHLLYQKRRMNKEDIEAILNALKDSNKHHIVFAVQGGVFAEGVDYPGNMVIGAFIIGPPLPNFDLEQETKKDYYQKRYAAGFEYAYVYPAMAKAIQSAGRVIRSETDKGIIVLIDNRFLHPHYAQCMPQDWFYHSQHELISQSILKDIGNFWAENDES